MSNISHELLSTVGPLLPDGEQGPWLAYPVALATAAAYIVHSTHQFNRLPEKDAVLGASEGALSQVQGNQESSVRRYRLGPVRVMTAGFALLGASFVSRPVVDGPAADTIAVIGTDYPMVYTHDISGGQSRFEVVKKGLEEAAANGNIGVVQYGDNVVTTLDLGVHKRQDFGAVSADNVNNNGNSIAGAITQAESLLPTNGKKKTGLIEIISDGVSNTTADLPDIQKNGVKVKVIVPGSVNSSYNVNGDTTSSAINPGIFISAYGEANVTVSNNAGAIEHSIESAIKSHNSGRQNQHWYPPYVIGGLALMGGFLWDRKQRVGKVI